MKKNNNTRCEIIDWRITAKCNNQCNFCYAAESIPEMSKEQREKVIDSIIKSGCKAVCISGGEPLLHEHAIEIMEMLYRNNITLFLSTNGSKYMQYRERIEPIISKLSLSLDGYDFDSQAVNGRNPHSFHDVINILEYYRKHQPRFSIKIGTLLSQKNMKIEHFKKMFELLAKYPIDLWKVYEFIPEGRGAESQAEFLLNPVEKKKFLAEFRMLQTSIRESYKFDCSLMTCEMRNSAYFIIRPDGKVIIPKESSQGVKEEIIGDLTTDSINHVLHVWNKHVDNIKYNTNIDSRNISKVTPRTSADEVGKKLLYLLDKNPLQDIKELQNSLRKDFGLSLGSDVIQAKINSLFGSRALYRIMPVVNVANFGLNVFLLNLYFKHSYFMDSNKIGELLAYKPYIAWVVQCKEYNSNDDFTIFRISVFAKNINTLNMYTIELRQAFGDLLDSIEIDLVPDKHILSQTYLLEKYGEKLKNDDLFNSHIELNTLNVKLTQDEFNVLVSMNTIDQLSIDNISRCTNFSKDKVNRIINNLLNKKVINKFDVVLDANILGYYVYLILIKFNNLSAKGEFEEYIKLIPNATHINTLCMGTWDIDVEVRVNQISTWADIWKDIEDKFGESITYKKLIRIEKEYNFKFLIDVTLDAMKSAIETDSDDSKPKKTITDRFHRL